MKRKIGKVMLHYNQKKKKHSDRLARIHRVMNYKMIMKATFSNSKKNK